MEAGLQGGAAAALIVGFLLGLRHATDADHVVAVSTIVSEYRNAWRGLWVGASWGLGHTTPLLIVGVAVLVFKETLLSRYEDIALYLEFGVGLMLVLLGAQVFLNLRRGHLHVHEHQDGGDPHVHIHGSHPPTEETDTAVDHGFFRPGRPFFRLKSYAVGVVHGLAGSAAVLLLLLPQVSSFAVGVLFIVLFGVGTVLSMSAITLALGVPFTFTSQFQRINTAIVSVAGIASILFGATLMAEIGLDVRLLPF